MQNHDSGLAWDGDDGVPNTLFDIARRHEALPPHFRACPGRPVCDHLRSCTFDASGVCGRSCRLGALFLEQRCAHDLLHLVERDLETILQLQSSMY